MGSTPNSVCLVLYRRPPRTCRVGDLAADCTLCIPPTTWPWLTDLQAISDSEVHSRYEVSDWPDYRLAGLSIFTFSNTVKLIIFALHIKTCVISFIVLCWILSNLAYILNLNLACKTSDNIKFMVLFIGLKTEENMV